MRTSHLLRILTPLALIVTLATACSGGDDAAAEAGLTSTTTAPPAASAASAVVIDGFQFSTPVSVKAGAEVEVRNEDGSDHTVTADDGSFDTSEVTSNGSASFIAPSEPGTYTFHCEIHPSMKGQLVVT